MLGECRTDREIMDRTKDSTKVFTLLSQLLLAVDENKSSEEISRTATNWSREEFGMLWGLANSHHVILRTFPRLYQSMLVERNERADWVDLTIAKEQARVHHALSFLSPICEALRDLGEVIVIKSLDHWPDLGSDLDLYTRGEAADVVAIMRQRFKAKVAARSWGDRLANKWNFIVPGLPELVEVHIGRLGQTGEQVAITESLGTRGSFARFGSHLFRVPAAEDRLIISTLQRMYRHFYIRLCDVADTTQLVESGVVDYVYLHSLARSAGLWDGLATYLTIVSGYVQSYRRQGLPLPQQVRSTARFGNERISFRQRFLRIPIFPQAASLYVSEWERLVLNGELQNALRLSLLPGLAAAAALELKITGSDKGIW
jgi:hypothetical protein